MTACETCRYFDEEEAVCLFPIDEDEWYRIMTLHKGVCPYCREAQGEDV